MTLDSLSWSSVSSSKRLLLSKRIVNSVTPRSGLTPRVSRAVKAGGEQLSVSSEGSTAVSAPPSSPAHQRPPRPLTTTTLAHQNMGFQDIRPTTGAPSGGVHVVQVVRRGEVEEEEKEGNNKTPASQPQSDGEAESLSIRNESGESLEDIVSIISIDEV